MQPAALERPLASTLMALAIVLLVLLGAPRHDDTPSDDAASHHAGAASDASGAQVLAGDEAGTLAVTAASVDTSAAATVAGAADDADEALRRLRGFNTTARHVDAAQVRRIAGWGGNVVRVLVGVDDEAWHERGVPTDPLAPYRDGLARVDEALAACRETGVSMILGASDIVGRRIDVFWRDGAGQSYRDHLPALWTALAARYRDEPALVAYDLLNEPDYRRGQQDTWERDMLGKAVAAVRAVDTRKWLVVEPGPWGMPDGFATLPVVDDPRVIYSFHHYAPHDYTHQGVGPERRRQWEPRPYPGRLRMFPNSREKHWDRAALRESMAPAVEFARRHRVRMLVGEFGVARWAPGGEVWLADSIALFEEFGFDWMYHAPAGWNGWNPTFGPDAPEAAQMGRDADGGERTPRLEVLLEALARNEALASPPP